MRRMDLRLTITTPRRVGAVTDVVITAPPGTPLRAVLPELRGTVGEHRHDHEISCAGTVLDTVHPLGTPPLVQGAVLVLSGSARPHPPVLEAHAVAGPDAGSTWPLRPGVNVVGRSPSSAIRPEDEDVSRSHTEIVVEPGRLIVRDRGSTNGTWLAGRRVETDEPLGTGQPLTVGATTLLIGRMPRPPAATVADGEGQIRVNRRPDVGPSRPSTVVTFPPRPEDSAPPRLPWPALVLPLFLAVPMAVFWHQPAFLAFAVLSPLLMAGQYLFDRRSGRRKAADRLRRRQELTDAAQDRLTALVEEDVRHLDELRPDLARLALAAATPTDDLWRRSPGSSAFLHLRLGLGPEISGITVRRADREAPVDEPVVHPRAPVVVDLPAVTVLGVCGPRADLLGLARSLIGQACVLHAPSEVRLTLIVADGVDRSDWQWAGRLPHHAPLRAAGSGTRVVVLAGVARLRPDPVVADVLRAAAAARTGAPAGTGGPAGTGSPAGTGGTGGTGGDSAALVLCLADREQELPVECGATVLLEPDGRAGTLRRPGAQPVTFAPDLAGPRWAERISRGLAPLRAAGADAAPLPSEVRLAELLAAELDPACAEAALRHWRRPGPRGPTALIGLDGSGPVRVDLRRDGPHGLVGGTTGAGKSELLQTLVTGLALDSGPDEVSFLLIDYKGGAAFRECLPLPHVTGLITDLDPRLAARALTSLRAELRRRERVLGEVGAVDLDEYRRTGRSLARLVVVVDEFRVLAEELPDFVAGLVRVAAVGRSLGVHLVLATQRPAGIVSPEIAANTNLRIALRLRDEGDSRDLIDDPAAARLPGDLPGRALLRVGSGPVRVVQVARVRGEPSGQKLSVRPAGPFTFSVDDEHPAPVLPRDEAGSTDLTALVRGLRDAAAAMGLDPPAPPWLPPLPETIRRGALSCPGAIGLQDVPEGQARRDLTWVTDGRHLAVAGGPRSGRTTAARTIVEAVAADQGAHVYVVDGSGALGDLERLGRVEAVVAVGDLERCERLIRRLRRAVTAAPERVALVVDGWEGLTTAWNDLDHGRLVDDLMALLRDGPAGGLRVAITGGRSLLTGAVSSLLTERLVLRFADPADALLAGIRGDLVSRSMPPGRGARLGPDDPDGHEVQIALPTGPPPAGTASRPGWAVPALPRRLSYEDFWSRTDGDPTGLPLGVGGESATVLTLSPAPLTVVLGPPGSGRSATLRSIAESLRRQGRAALLTTLTVNPAGPGSRADVADVSAALRAGVTVLVDGIRPPSALGESPADRLGDVIVEHLSAAAGSDDGWGVVLACSPTDVLSGFRGLPVAARAARQGLVLGHPAAAAEVFGVRVTRYPGAPPGRATLIRDGRSTSVQLPLPPVGRSEPVAHGVDRFLTYPPAQR
jgi:DNA segregation ATPase FtsK/SpoIIIE, S-DNA-T family